MSDQTSRRVVLVTGASSGIGKETARLLRMNDFVVYGAARRTERMSDLKSEGIHILSLDVTDEKSIETCVGTILEREGRIDVLVNNAGYGSYGAIEDVRIDEARRQFEVNLFGLARLVQTVLPSMRQNGFGRIINISSMGGKIYTPFGGWYHATKFALEGFSDCLRLETEPFGIDVVVIEPGGIKTDWGIIAARQLKDASGGGAYGAAAMHAAGAMAVMYKGDQLSPPSVVAEAILKASTAKKPKTRYAIGYGAKLSIFLRRWLSDRAFDWFVRRFAA